MHNWNKYRLQYLLIAIRPGHEYDTLFTNVRRFNVDAPITVTISDCGRFGETWVNILQRSLETRSINAMHHVMVVLLHLTPP